MAGLESERSRLRFSVLCNEIPGNVPIRSAKKLQEAVVDLLAEQLQAAQN